MFEVIFKKSNRKDKKFMVIIRDKIIHFGAKGYSDYTIHKDKERKKQYILRHKVRENWTKTGINTAGFWSKWILWNKPTIKESVKDLQKKYKINVVYN
jgi:hypothetical protein